MVVLITVTATDDDNYVDDNIAGTISNLQHDTTAVLMPSLQCSQPQPINSS